MQLVTEVVTSTGNKGGYALRWGLWRRVTTHVS